MSKLPIFEHFRSVGKSQAKTQVVFQAKTQAEIVLLNWPTGRRRHISTARHGPGGGGEPLLGGLDRLPAGPLRLAAQRRPRKRGKQPRQRCRRGVVYLRRRRGTYGFTQVVLCLIFPEFEMARKFKL